MLLGHSDISITAKIYIHLLDGDLKVQDEVRLDFDKQAVSRDIDKTKDAGQAMVMTVVQTLTSALGNTPEGRRALFSLIQTVSDESGKFQPESTMSIENAGLDTLMLRSDPKTLIEEASDTTVCLELASKSQLFTGLKLEPMGGIEPPTYALRKRCSTTELHRHQAWTEFSL